MDKNRHITYSKKEFEIMKGKIKEKAQKETN
jgi:hypothetical protein